MPDTTTRLGLPYPESSDPADVPADVQALADAIEDLPGFTNVFSAQALYPFNMQGTEKGMTLGSAPQFNATVPSTGMVLVEVDPDRFGDAPEFRLAGAAMIPGLTTARVPTLALRRVTSWSGGLPSFAVASLTCALPSVAAADTRYAATGTAGALSAGLYALTVSTPGQLHASGDLHVWAQLQVRQ